MTLNIQQIKHPAADQQLPIIFQRCSKCPVVVSEKEIRHDCLYCKY